MNAISKLGSFLNSKTGLLVVSGVFLAYLIIGYIAAKPLAKKHYRGQFVVILALIFVSILFLIITYSFRKSGVVHSGVIPRLWIFGILACCVYLLITIFTGKESPDPEGGSLQRPIIFILVTLTYIVLMPYLGFFIASFVFLAAAIIMLEYRRWGVILAVSAGWIAFNYFLFYKLLFVPFPQGIILKLLQG